MNTFTFPVGYHRMHKTKIIDYQLNRWYSLGYTRLEDMQEAAGRIRSLEDWMPEMVRQAEKALEQGRILNATFYYRAAEFFVLPEDPEKQRLYDKFQDLFYNQVVADDPIKRASVPFAGGFLPVLRVPSRAAPSVRPEALEGPPESLEGSRPQPSVRPEALEGPEELEGRTSDAPSRGNIVLFGGFDSFMEELYSWACYFADLGYDVDLFEGPGQGAALKHGNLTLDYRWEQPTAAVLDHLHLTDVTLVGVSMGGWLVFRAAALEPRVRRVIASSTAFDYLQIPPAPVTAVARWLLRRHRLINALARLNARLFPQERWQLHNLMYITRKDTPAEAAQTMLAMNEENLLSDRVTQDVLILTGAKDHFIPMKLHHKQVAALTNARSVTPRVFTPDEHAADHCQVGNMALALDVMSSWLAEKSTS